MRSKNNCLLGLYEKALPADLCWNDRLKIAKESGYDFVEISIDETSKRRARLNWNNNEIKEILDAMFEQDMPILTMCLSGNRKFPIGAEDDMARKRGIDLIKDAVDFSLKIGIRIVQLAS